MRILISNDDGVNAPGIKVLAQALEPLAQTHVVAPDRDRSGASHSLTLETPLRMETLDNGFMSVNGTPSDCVHLAITGGLEQSPDMVVSGINAGANLGDDVLYSGTVAAAMEGRFLGFPTLAVSLVSDDHRLEHYHSAGVWVKRLVSTILENPLKKEVILNVNVPDLPLEQIKGMKVTRLGSRHASEKIIEGKDPRDKTIYWVGPAGPGQDAGPGTDFHAVKEGYVSVTPLQTDLTDHSQMPVVESWINAFDIAG